MTGTTKLTQPALDNITRMLIWGASSGSRCQIGRRPEIAFCVVAVPEFRVVHPADLQMVTAVRCRHAG
jgi:hypothetical protein